GVAERAVAVGAGPGAAGQAVVVAAGELRCGGGGAGQQREEAREAVAVEGEVGRELPEDGAELVAEEQHAGGEEVGERRLDVAQLLHVGDEAAALDGEEEAGRRRVVPAAEAGRALERVERAVDLDAVEPTARVLEFAAARQSGRIEAVVPAPVRPAGDADAQVHAVHPNSGVGTRVRRCSACMECSLRPRGGASATVTCGRGRRPGPLGRNDGGSLAAGNMEQDPAAALAGAGRRGG